MESHSTASVSVAPKDSIVEQGGTDRFRVQPCPISGPPGVLQYFCPIVAGLFR